ncbi:iron-containing alcohol dehydrogenase [Pseudomonas sp. SZMC_28357]|uniref:iron-containing alcohol dehydrogenase n=1 Tax=Pseudomonas sp. SZMC_28357 TaxID=3074380 RepID=UPI0028728DFD|nr:iron-containing alcohol dehydrogenase [Pseudomonas sp. SZMC_28357]MDR9749914.1 iron-containing alcohol dehydrogenase [Pseudomonas sp. SZMC_28357]
MIDPLSPLSRQQWTLPVPIEYGPGARSALADMCLRHGIRAPLIVTDASTASLPFVSELLDHLQQAGLRCSLYAGIEANPTDTSVENGAAFFRDWQADGVVALGGGSGLDAGKAIALIAAQSRAGLWAFDFDQPVADSFKASDFPPVICVPTTAGTGAETESTAMLTDTRRGIKGCVWHPLARPAGVILDPELTLGLPPHLTAWTGMDAIIHALEAFFVPQFNPLCDGAALQALSLMWDALPVAVKNGDNLEARGRMLAGSCLAGVAFNKGLGLVHALSHMVGATYNTHHGLTNAVILPVVLRFNQDLIRPRLPAVCQAMGLPGEDFETFYRAICARLDALDIPKNLVSLGVQRQDFPAIAAKALLDPARSSNPRASDLTQLEQLLTQALDHARK